MGEGIFIHRGE